MSAWSTKSEEPCMGSPIEALRETLSKWREWTKYTGAAMGTRKQLDERDARERQARSEFTLAAAALAWHLDHNPELMSELGVPDP